MSSSSLRTPPSLPPPPPPPTPPPNIHRRLSSRILSRKPSGILQTFDSKLFEKETKVVDGIAFTAATSLSKFSFKKDLVTIAKDEISEDDSVLSEIEMEEINEGKARNFEFTNNKSVMRVLRAILFLQMIGIICDNPAVQFPPLFDVLCRTPFFYLIRFYSFPFVSVVYFIQKFWKRALKFFISLYHLLPTKPPDAPDASDTDTPQRHLESRSDFYLPPLSVCLSLTLLFSSSQLSGHFL